MDNIFLSCPSIWPTITITKMQYLTVMIVSTTVLPELRFNHAWIMFSTTSSRIKSNIKYYSPSHNILPVPSSSMTSVHTIIEGNSYTVKDGSKLYKWISSKNCFICFYYLTQYIEHFQCHRNFSDALYPLSRPFPLQKGSSPLYTSNKILPPPATAALVCTHNLIFPVPEFHVSRVMQYKYGIFHFIQ